MVDMILQSRRLRQRCDTVFSATTDSGIVTSKCGCDFLDGTRDLGGGIVFKRGLVKCTRQGIHVVCPKCKHTVKVDDRIIGEVIKVLLEYRGGELTETI